MKIVPVNYLHGGLSLEIVAETPVETALLVQIFTHGCMEMGSGKSITVNDMATGFYLKTAAARKEGA